MTHNTEGWAVSAEWANDTAGEVLAVFVGPAAEHKARRFAEEKEYEYATGDYVPGRRYSVWGFEGNEDPDWEITINVEKVKINPPLPELYRRREWRKVWRAKRKAGVPTS